jgi:hypothetical protein
MESGIERRAQQRISTWVEVPARVAGRPGRVRVADLSTNGCHVVTSHGFVAPGDPILLTFEGMRIIGIVVWQDGRDAGVKFRNPMHAALVAHLGYEPTQLVPMARLRPALAQRVRPPSQPKSRSSILRAPRDVTAFFQASRF